MLLGRSAELTRLNDLVLAAQEGHSAAVVISGEAGIGKSALAESVARTAATQADTAILRTRGIEAEYDIPFAGLADLLQPVQHLLPELPEPQAAALETALAFGPPTRGQWFAVGAATLNLLAAAAQGGSLLCVVEDAHWLDESSAEALLFAAHRMRAEGVVIVFTVRGNEPGAGRFAALEHQVRLGGLDAESATELLVRGAGRSLPVQVVQRLVADTGGNPLALLELPGQLTEDQLSGRTPIPDLLPINALLRESFLRQVRTLPQRTNTALLLVATSELEATDLVEQALRQAGGSLADLESAEAAGLLNIGNGRLAFQHPLIRLAVFHAASPAQRRMAHHQLAAALEFVPAPQAEERRAWHLAEATLTADEKVAALLEQVGAAADRRLSHAEAAQAFERAAGLSPGRTERARRLFAAAEAAVPAGLVQQAIQLLAQVRTWTDDPATAARAECEQYRLAAWGGSAPEDSQARLFDFAARMEDQLPAVAARAYLAAAQASLFRYDSDAITRAVERAARLAGTDERVALHCDVLAAIAAAQAGATDRACELLARHQAQLASHPTSDLDQIVLISAVCYLALQQTAEARPLLARAVEASRAANAAGLLTHQLPWMALLEWLDGNWITALALADEAVELAPQTGWLSHLPPNLSTLARIEAGFGMPSCREHAEAALAAARSSGQVTTKVHALAAIGLLELGLGRFHDAAEVLQQAWDAAAQAAPNLHLQILPDLVTAYTRAGLPDQATEKLAQLDNLAAGTRHCWVRAAAAHCHGLLEPRDFAEWFEQALRWHAQGTAPFDRARTHLAYGERLHRGRNRAGARVQLQQALELFERLGAAPWVERTRDKLLSSGGSAPAQGGPIAQQLTRQELRVALTIQRGLSNADAAAALFLSIKTIEYHLSNIYHKLGINSRTQLIRALSEGLPHSDMPLQDVVHAHHTSRHNPPPGSGQLNPTSLASSQGNVIYQVIYQPSHHLGGSRRSLFRILDRAGEHKRAAGPLEVTWIESHRRRTGCKCDVVKKKGFMTYICVKCGREI